MYKLILFFSILHLSQAIASDLNGSWVTPNGNRLEIFRIGNEYRLSNGVAQYRWSINEDATTLFGKETHTIVDPKCRQQVLKFENNSTLQINSAQEVIYKWYKIYYKKRVITNGNGGQSFGDCQLVEAVENYSRLIRDQGGNEDEGGQSSDFFKCRRYAQRISNYYEADQFRFTCFRKFRHVISSSQCLFLANDMNYNDNKDQMIRNCYKIDQTGGLLECRRYARRITNGYEADNFRFMCFRKYRSQMSSQQCLAMANEMIWTTNSDEMVRRCYELEESFLSQ